MNISGTYFLDKYLSIEFGSKSTTVPQETIAGDEDNSTFLIWAAQALPKDGLAALAVNTLSVYNYGAPVQVEAFYKLESGALL